MVLITHSRVDLLGSEDRPLRLVWRGPLRRSPVTRASLDILLVLADARSGEQSMQWLPFSEFGYYPLDTEFRGQETWFPVDAIRNFRTLAAQEDFLVPDEVALKVNHEVSAEVTAAISGFQHRMTLDRSQNPPVVIANMEIGRFYLAAISLLANDLLSFDVDPGKAFKAVCNPRETRLEDGVLLVAPHHGYLSRPAALQVSLLSISDDILAFWAAAIRQFRALNAGKRPLNFHGWFPQGSGEIDGVSRRRTIEGEGGQVETVVELKEIVRDRRVLPLHTVVVQMPYNTDSGVIDELNAGIDAEGEAPSPRTRNLLDQLLGRSGSTPGTRSALVAIAGHTLPRAFPALDGLTVEYVRKRGPLHSVAAALSIFKSVEGAASGKPRPTGVSARITHRHASGEPRREIDFDLMVAPPAELDPIEWLELRGTNLQPAIAALHEAGVRFAQKGLVPSDVPSLIDADDGNMKAGIIPASWGRWSEGYARNRRRRLFVLPLVVEERFFWIIELESNDKSKPHGLGVLQPAGGFEPEVFLNDFVAGVRRRQLKAPSGTVAAPFPRGHFPDASVGYLKHTGERLKPIFLESAIRLRCKRMIDEQRLLSQR